MLTVSQAEEIIFSLVQPLQSAADSETLALPMAMGRVLAEDVQSQLDFPHWDNSAMDGYAVRYADVQTCSAEAPAQLQVIEEIPAGAAPHYQINAGQAARILTGSMMPPGADTVVMQEDTQRQGSAIAIMAPPAKMGAFVRRQGTYYRAGTPLLAAGTRLNAPEIAILAASQVGQVQVFRQPKVAILSTGSELAELDQPLQPGQIVDSNRYALATLVAQTGGIPVPLGIVPDQIEALRQAIAEAIATTDVVLSSGGVSVGDYDYVEQVLTELGGEIHIRSIAIKPGKPLTVATFSNPHRGKSTAPVLYFGLPGNPVSALVTFWRFVQPALGKLAGLPPAVWKPVILTAHNREMIPSDGKRETYVWGHLTVVEKNLEFAPAEGIQISGNLINLATINALAVIPQGVTQLAAAESISVLQVAPIKII